MRKVPFARELGELIDAISRADTVEDIHAFCASLCHRYGFDYFHYGAQIPTSFLRPELIFVSGFPNAWWVRYNERHYVRVDPVVTHTLNRVTPLVWVCEPGKDDGSEPPEVREFMCDARDFGVRSGVTFPVHGSHGETALLSLVLGSANASTERLLDGALPAGQLLAAYIHEATLRVFQDGLLPVMRVELSPRERECLLWTAEGKTTWEIATILGISERTVAFHLHNVTHKLNVSNRSHAVARAMALQLITPQLD